MFYPKTCGKDDDSHFDDTAHMFVHPGSVDDTNGRAGHMQVILRHRSCCDSG